MATKVEYYVKFRYSKDPHVRDSGPRHHTFLARILGAKDDTEAVEKAPLVVSKEDSHRKKQLVGKQSGELLQVIKKTITTASEIVVEYTPSL